MTSDLRLPASVTGRQPKGTPETLRSVQPFAVVAPIPLPAKVRAIGSHTIRLREKLQTAAATIDGVEVLFASDLDGREVHVLADTSHGIVEVLGWTAEQHDAIRRDYFDGRGIKPAATSRPAPSATPEVDRLVALAATLDDENAPSGDAEVDRLAKLASELTDG